MTEYDLALWNAILTFTTGLVANLEQARCACGLPVSVALDHSLHVAREMRDTAAGVVVRAAEARVETV